MALSQSLRFFLFFFFFFTAFAAPGVNIPRLYRHDNADADTTSSNDNSTSLEPVVPPEVDTKDLSIFELDTHVMLAWAGSPGSELGTKRMRKRDEAIFSQASFIRTTAAELSLAWHAELQANCH